MDSRSARRLAAIIPTFYDAQTAVCMIVALNYKADEASCEQEEGPYRHLMSGAIANSSTSPAPIE